MTKIQELAERAKGFAREIDNSQHYLALIVIIDELAGIAEAPQEVNGIKDIPPDSGDNEGYSDSYLIDLNGWRKDFAIGHYDHDNKRWIIHDDKRTMLELDHMTWQRLPLAKYDSERS